MLLVDGRDIIDIKHFAALVARRLETHIVHMLGLQHSTESAARIAEVEHQSLARTVDIPIHNRGVLSFAGILRLQRPVAIRRIQAHRSCPHIERQIEPLAGIGGRGDAFIPLIFRHEARSQREMEFALRHGRYKAIQIGLCINATHQPIAPLPIVALLTCQGFNRYAFPGAEEQVHT